MSIKAKLIQFICIFFLTVSSAFSGNNLIVNLISGHDIYEPGEIISFQISITNNGTEDFKLFYNCSFVDDALWALVFKNADGKIFNLSVSFAYDCFSNPIIIKAGDIYTAILPVTYKFLKFRGFDYLPPGKYSVFFNRQDLGRSDTLKIEVTGTDNNQEFSKYQNADTIKNLNKRFVALRDLLYNPACKHYHSKAILEMTYMFNFTNLDIDLDKFKQNLMYYFERNADSFEAGTILILYCRKLNENERSEYLAAVGNKFNGSLLGNLADEMYLKKNIQSEVY